MAHIPGEDGVHPWQRCRTYWAKMAHIPKGHLFAPGMALRGGCQRNCIVPKKSGRWKSGFAASMGFHDRKCGRLSPSPHL